MAQNAEYFWEGGYWGRRREALLCSESVNNKVGDVEEGGKSMGRKERKLKSESADAVGLTGS